LYVVHNYCCNGNIVEFGNKSFICHLPEPTQPFIEPVHTPRTTYVSDDTVLTNLNMASLLKTLTGSINQNRLPPPELSGFYGDALKYPSPKASFTTPIESRTIAPLERIRHLKKYVSGEAKECIKGNVGRISTSISNDVETCFNLADIQ